MPAGGYCWSITRKKLLLLWLAALLLFLGVAVCVYGWTKLQADKSAWDYMEYVKLAIGWIAGLFFVSGIGAAYKILKEAMRKKSLKRNKKGG